MRVSLRRLQVCDAGGAAGPGAGGPDRHRHSAGLPPRILHRHSTLSRRMSFNATSDSYCSESVLNLLYTTICAPTFSFPFVLDCYQFYELWVAQGEGRSSMMSDAETDSKPILLYNCIFMRETCVLARCGGIE